MCFILPIILMSVASLLGWLLGRQREEVDTTHYDTTIKNQTLEISNLQSKVDNQSTKYKELDTKFYNAKLALDAKAKPEKVEVIKEVEVVKEVPVEVIKEVEKIIEKEVIKEVPVEVIKDCLLYTSPSPRDQRGSRMPSSA